MGKCYLRRAFLYKEASDLVKTKVVDFQISFLSRKFINFKNKWEDWLTFFKEGMPVFIKLPSVTQYQNSLRHVHSLYCENST